MAIAGPDRKFRWVKGSVDGAKVIVLVPPGQPPAWLKYAWANLPEANLVSKAGLPVAPVEKSIQSP